MKRTKNATTPTAKNPTPYNPTYSIVEYSPLAKIFVITALNGSTKKYRAAIATTTKIDQIYYLL